MSHRFEDGRDCPACTQYGGPGQRRPSCGVCGRCGRRDGKPQRCPGDGASHHHGEVHLKNGGRELVCDVCIVEVTHEWNPHLSRDQVIAALHGGEARRQLHPVRT